jgi:hypothetical protein
MLSGGGCDAPPACRNLRLLVVGDVNTARCGGGRSSERDSGSSRRFSRVKIRLMPQRGRWGGRVVRAAAGRRRRRAGSSGSAVGNLLKRRGGGNLLKRRGGGCVGGGGRLPIFVVFGHT